MAVNVYVGEFFANSATSSVSECLRFHYQTKQLHIWASNLPPTLFQARKYFLPGEGHCIWL